MTYFEEQGRALLGGGYLIIPIKPGHKRPALDSWQTARLGVGDLVRYRAHGVGVLCGQGANPIAAIDVDTTDGELAGRFVAWCHEHLGVTCERVGNAPKILLPYRAAAEGWGKATGAWFEDELGERHRLEVLGKGQQFVAYHIHPDTGAPYEWVDFLGGLEAMPAAELPVITEEQVARAVAVFEQMAEDVGLVRCKAPARAAVPKASREAPADDDFFGRVNAAALASLSAWVPALFPAARDYRGGYRVASVDLMRDLEEDLSLVPEGIVDFGVADMGDAREGKRTPIDVVLEWAPRMLDDAFAIATPLDAAMWLCDCMDTPREELGFGLRKQKERAERLSKKRTDLDDAKGIIAGCNDSIELVNVVAPRAGELAGDDIALRAELAGLIRARFKELTGTALPAADVRVAMAGSRKAPAQRERSRRGMTEFGNAERMLDHYGEGLMYVPELAGWYAWTGVHWRRIADEEMEHRAKETIRALPDEAKLIESDAERAEFFKFCAVSQRAVMTKNMVTLARSDPRVMTPVVELDRDRMLLGVGNGAVDLRTGARLAPNPAHRITVATPVDYAEDARAPLFEATVRDVFHGDAEMVAFFQRLVGYSILGDPKEDILVIPYGSGSNGKSTVVGAIRDALGEHAKIASADTFLSSGGGMGGSAGAAREDVLRLRGARFVYVSEPDEGSELREGMVKSMTGGDPIPARGLYSKSTVEVTPTWVAFMPTNHRPIIKGDDHAIWRRLLPVPFTRNFDQDKGVKKDPDRAAKLKAEASGILRWCVAGALAYQREGLNPPGAVKAARDEYRTDMDLLAEWLAECCEVGPNHRATTGELWASWEAFAKARGEIKFISSAKALGRRLQSRGFEAFRDTAGVRGRAHWGLRVTGGGLE
jgi:P4 family phage/plasmid primase-like protien